MFFLSWIPADAAITEEEEWSDEFDDDTLGVILLIIIIKIKNYGTIRILNEKLLNISILQTDKTEWIVLVLYSKA